MWTLGARATGIELIDGPIESREELAQSFRDLALINRRFGGISVARSALRSFEPLSVLDLGCGTAEIAASLRGEARAAGRDVVFTCVDNNSELLAIGRARYAADPCIRFVQADASQLPFEDDSFDVAMCNLALHHFAPGDAVRLLREMRRVSRIAPVVTDLQRSLLTWLAAFSFSRVFTRNRVTRHDAPLSARRAYTRREAMELAREAGWSAPRIRSHVLIRMILYDGATI